MKTPAKNYVDVFTRAVTFITEFIDSANVGIFVNWVENGETYRAEVFNGNQFALKGQINKWACEHLDELSDGYHQAASDDEDDQ
jgi:hypothetical protein